MLRSFLKFAQRNEDEWDDYFSVQYKGAANLSSKMIRVLPVDLKWSLGRCKIINLSNNSFSEIPASIQSLTKLESLNISQNILSGGFPQLKQLPNLTELDISGCYLPTLPEEVSHIKTLRRLNISKNTLDGTFLERFALLSNLEWLNISETNALTLKHPNLKTLILNRNHINNYSFEGLPSLTEVSVASNSFKSLKPFAKLKNLENLDILNNYQEWDDLPKLKHLKQLKISLTEHRNSLELLKKLNRLTSLTLAISFLQLSTVFHLLTFVGAIKPVNDYFPDLNSEEKMIFSLIPQIFKPFDLSGLKLTEFHLEIRNLNTLLTFSRESCDDPWQISADFIEKKNYIPTKLEFFRCRDVYLGFDEEANIIFAPLLVYGIYKLQQTIPVQSFFVYQGNNICLALDDCGNLYTAKKKATIIANQVREFNEKLRLDEDGKLFHEDNKLRPISFRVRTFASVGVLHMFGDYEQNIWLLYNLNVDPCNITSKLPPEVDLPIVKIYALKESFYLIDSRGVVWVCDHLMQHAPNLDLITFSRLNFQDPVKFLWYDTAASSDIILVTTSGEVYVRSYDIKRYGILISKAEFNLLENVNIFIKAPPKSALK